MNYKFGFYKYYFLLALLLLLIEFIIGADFHDAIIRPYGGDFLVVILIYCIIKSFVNPPVVQTACAVLIFAILVEISQYFHLINLLGWQHSTFARLMLGTSFSFTDIFAYILGTLLVIIVEKIKQSMSHF